MAIKRNLTISLIEIFLLKLLYLSCVTFGESSNITVLDTDGHEVLPNVMYKILPAPGFEGGGIVLSDEQYLTCTFNIMQAPEKGRSGVPVKFFPADPKQEKIQLSHDINIGSTAITICMRSKVWQINLDEATKRWYLRSSGVEGNPGAETQRNWFKIEKVGNGVGYKIAYCPSVCKTKCGLGLCEDVGVFDEGDKWWLGLGGRKLSVVFNKSSNI